MNRSILNLQFFYSIFILGIAGCIFSMNILDEFLNDLFKNIFSPVIIDSLLPNDQDKETESWTFYK